MHSQPAQLQRLVVGEQEELIGEFDNSPSGRLNPDTVVLSFDETGIHSDGEPIQKIAGEYEHLATVHKEVCDIVEQFVISNEFSLLCLIIVDELADLEVVILNKAVEEVGTLCSYL